MTLEFNIHSITPIEQGGGEVNNQNKTFTENGTYTADSGYTGLGTVTVNVQSTEPTLASLTITPSTTSQSITPLSGTDGYNTISVEAVTASIDADIVASNIKSGVNILGVNGSVTELVGETTTITTNGTYAPTIGNGFTSVDVNVQGGGGGVSEQSTLRAVMDLVTPNCTYKDLYDNGWVFSDYYKDTASTNTDTIYFDNWVLYGLYFDKNLTPNVLYASGINASSAVKAIKVPTGTVVTDASTEHGETPSSNGSRLKIDFTNASEKWIVFCGGSAYNTDNFSINSFYNTEARQNYIYGLESFVKWMECDYISTTYTESSKYEPQVSNGTIGGSGSIFDAVISRGRNLKGFNLSNNVKLSQYNSGSASVYSPSSGTNILKSFLPKSPLVYDSLKKFVNNNTIYTYGETSCSLSVIADSNWGVIARAAYFPFILDASGSANAIYINCNGNTLRTGSNKEAFEPLIELFIKIPAQDTNWVTYWFGYSSANMVINNITPASLTYLANNAPSATSKTLKIGTLNALSNPTAVATLTSKGWTVV